MSSIEESPEESRKFIKRLHEASKEDMMDAMYSSIVNGKMGALKHDGTNNRRIHGIHHIFFRGFV